MKKILKSLKHVSAKFIIDLKYSEGCNLFLQSLTHACNKCNSRQNLRVFYSTVLKEYSDKIIGIRERHNTILQKINNKIQLSYDDLSRIEEFMSGIANVTFEKTYNENEEPGRTIFIQGTEIIHTVDNMKIKQCNNNEKRKIEYQINSLLNEIWNELPSYKDEAPEYYKKYNDVANELDKLSHQLSSKINIDLPKINDSYESLRKIWEDRNR